MDNFLDDEHFFITDKGKDQIIEFERQVRDSSIQQNLLDPNNDSIEDIDVLSELNSKAGIALVNFHFLYEALINYNQEYNLYEMRLKINSILEDLLKSGSIRKVIITKDILNKIIMLQTFM